MAKEPALDEVTTSQGQGDLLIGLDLDYYDSEEELDGDSEIGDFSDSDNDFDSDVTLEELAQGGHDIPKGQRTGKFPQNNVNGVEALNGGSMAVVPADAAASDPYDVDSDEEKNLLKGIKDEIKDMVRGEMQSELAVYEHKLKAIEAGRLSSVDGGAAKEGDKYPDLADLDPELRDAYIKMRKLDRILEKKMKKEKEVKRDRILLERRMRVEIGAMQNSGRVQRDIQANTEKYLSLALPPSHNQGVIVDEPPVTPVFQTQVSEHDLRERAHQRPSAAGDGASTSQDGRESSAASSRTDGTASSVEGDRSKKHGHRRKRRKDFIKRNKELAANANDMIAMTDDEKKRLQELLVDIDALPELPEEGVDVSVDENPYQVCIHPGEGFLPSDNEQRTLTAIDQRLQSIMPEDEFRSIASSTLSHASQQRLFTRVGARSEVDFESYGEKALMEVKDEREVNTKLKEIEDRLAVYQNTEVTQSESPALSEEQLEHLLDDCVRSMSRISMPTDTPGSLDSARTLESARAQLMVNPPKLSDEMLQKLLSEAHFPLSSHLLALQDDDSKSAHSGDDGGVIRAETWKAIADETLSGEEDESSTVYPNPTDNGQGPHPHPQPHHTSLKQSSIVPHPSLSDTSVRPTPSRKPPLYRYSSQTSDSDGFESRVSLPEICSSPLINTPQGGATVVPNNDPLQYHSGRSGIRTSSSLDSMVRNDLSREMPHSRLPSNTQRMAGTPLMIEEVGDQNTPTPHPPPASERSASRRSILSRSDTLETDPKS